MPEPTYLTAEGHARLKTELVELKGTHREELAKRLRDAIQMGDLSENADYHKAKEDQGFLEGRIQELEYIVHNAVIIEDTSTPAGEVGVGSKVTIQERDGEPEIYQVVGSKEANPRSGRISNESPIGRALMGRRVGDNLDVETPAGKMQFKILEIN